MTRWRPEKIVVWPAVGFDSYGEVLLGAPQSFDARWEDTRREVAGGDATPIAVDVEIFVEKDLPIGSVIWRGRKKDLPTNPTPLYRAVAHDIVYDLKGRNSNRSILLSKQSMTLPTLQSEVEE